VSPRDPIGNLQLKHLRCRRAATTSVSLLSSAGCVSLLLVAFGIQGRAAYPDPPSLRRHHPSTACRRRFGPITALRLRRWPWRSVAA